MEYSVQLKNKAKKRILKRLQSLSDGICIALGSRIFDRDTLIRHVRKESEVGKLMIRIETEFLRPEIVDGSDGGATTGSRSG
ncbi:MAG: hypothetical protein A3H06_00945 [Candidatus Colwellbacteria bacterium RIFCSPLOWO2_12_FULL_44_13]|uniref:Uncharacterized protein n=3 Tax=Candidatus Colwelliibacteriota TaxID=1817904 RepID=A0A1G1Z6C7_9BACT|nr:MAG: hypothetical protein A3F24_02120 [Candidatus Colwellbacteria bacterium RIFCSPHIGHO2_12_FULL_44_17]OGY59999.1 MAG: hypothetical protein A3I31_00965 [Candidatus Colwellbacteria bacterium RIFCSPLOWO2_02_FULL_44_20b]OGY61028.1 MAG: hypothetical protein A3H06_00945 [Candidatus Colwellbacteria bacterium RIFCSPLOWO2_12_FULL_44_13]